MPKPPDHLTMTPDEIDDLRRGLALLAHSSVEAA
jgi:hypothetical protein